MIYKFSINRSTNICRISYNLQHQILNVRLLSSCLARLLFVCYPFMYVSSVLGFHKCFEDFNLMKIQFD
jgi:hypothetical protein